MEDKRKGQRVVPCPLCKQKLPIGWHDIKILSHTNPKPLSVRCPASGVKIVITFP
jgi:hypothetical protein